MANISFQKMSISTTGVKVEEENLRNNCKHLAVISIIVICIVIGILIFCFGKGEYKYSVNEDGTITIEEYLATSTEVIIPETIKGKQVTVIGESCFYENTNLVSVTIPNTVKRIDEDAFRRCESLEVVYGGENVIQIEDGAFQASHQLHQITLHEGLISIGDWAFTATNIENIILPSTLKSIGIGAFFGSQLVKIEIPTGVETIGNMAFGNADVDESVLPESDYMPYCVVGQGILLDYPKDESIVIVPDGVKQVSDCYHRGGELKELYIADSVVRISPYIIESDHDVTVYIPSGVESIGNSYDREQEDIASDMTQITLVVEAGSFAEKYATQKASEYGITYHVVDTIKYPE